MLRQLSAVDRIFWLLSMVIGVMLVCNAFSVCHFYAFLTCSMRVACHVADSLQCGGWLSCWMKQVRTVVMLHVLQCWWNQLHVFVAVFGLMESAGFVCVLLCP